MSRTTITLLLSAAVAPAQDIEFNRDIRPILSEHCYPCHGPDAKTRKAKLRLDLAENALAKRKGTPAITPYRPDRSELIARITHPDPDERMPPRKRHKRPTEAEISLLTRWIKSGAVFEPHWSLTPPKRQPPPPATDADWSLNLIDRWILARLKASNLTPSAEADRRILLRRLTFDLTGLPPTPEELDAFLSDTKSTSYENLVERLLASPHHAERMAMYWLDLVRYADTVGYHGDQEQKIAPYRDWVIDAFRQNMPFDQFTIEQIAGDLLPEATTQQRVATGYNRVLQTTHEGGAQAKEYLAIYAADRVRNLSSVWMGATLGCCQCHDHKYDPYTLRDFYSLSAFFADIQERGDFKGSPNTSPTTRPPELPIFSASQRKAIAKLDDEIAKLKASPDRIKGLTKQRQAIEKKARRSLITVATKPRITRVLPRGDWLDESGEIILPATPHFMRQVGKKGVRADRLDLARWLVSKDQPQTARVMVNRLWYLFFGKGISARLDDLGAQGEPPVHPELLDALAVEFMESGWNIRHVVRLIVTSRTYRQSSLHPPRLQEIDPDNRLVARQSRWRLPAETIRDAALSVSGLLIREIGGDSVKPYQPAGLYRHLNFPKRRYAAHADKRNWRRGIYMHWQRTFLHPALKAFDAPTREECVAERNISNTPQAALTLLNDPSFIEAARSFAIRIMTEGGINDRARITHAFKTLLCRAPGEKELAVLTTLLGKHRSQFHAEPQSVSRFLAIGMAPIPKELDRTELAAWISVTRSLLNLNEAITRN